MELLLKSTKNHYDVGDVIDIRPDGFQWSTGAQMTEHFTIVKNVTLSATEEALLRITDDKIVIPKSAIKTLAQRHKLLASADRINDGRRRRYTFANNIMEQKNA